MDEKVGRLVELYQDMRAFLKSKETDIYGFFVEGVDGAKDIWNEMRPMIEEYLRDVKGEIPDIKFMRDYKLEDKVEGFDMHDWNVLLSILRNVILRYCNFDGKELKDNFGEDFRFPSMEGEINTAMNVAYVRHKCMDYDATKDKEICLLITPRGEAYYAINGDHASLAYWLNINGVDLHNAIHFEATKSSGAFLITSLYQFAFSKGSNGDRFVKLTYQQVDMLNCLYDTISNMWPRTKSITYMIRASQGFGIGMNDEDKAVRQENPLDVATNLRRLHLCMPTNFDAESYREYVKDMRLGGSLHHRLM